MLLAYALKDGKISKDDRICQFRILKSMDSHIAFDVVDDMKCNNRGGIGSTGTR